MFLKKLFSHSLIYTIGPQIPRIAGLFVLPIITQFLTTTDYGVYGIVISYIGIFTALSDLGFSVVLVNSYYQYPEKWGIIWRQLHFYLALWSIFYGLLMAICLYFIVPDEARHHLPEIIMLVCLPTILCNPAIILGSRYYQFAQKPMFIATSSAIVGVTAIFLNLYTIAYLKMGYMGWFVSTAISTLVQFLFFLYPVYFKYKLGPIFTFRKLFLYKHLKVSLPTVPHNYSSYLLTSSDRVIMDRMNLPVGEIGKYNMAYIFGNYFDFVSIAVGMAVGPFYIKLISRKTPVHENQIYVLTHWLQYGFLAAGFVICVWCKEILQVLISNEELQLVYPLAIIIIMSYVNRPYYWAVVNKLQYHEKTSQFWKISFIAGIINIILNIIFIPIYGIMAAAVITFLALLYMNFAGFFLRSYKQLATMKYYPVKMILFCIVTTAGAWLLKDVSIWYKIGVSTIILGTYCHYTWRKLPVFKQIEV